MRRPDVLTPVWFVLMAFAGAIGGLVYGVIDGLLDGEFRWSSVVMFGLLLFVLNVGMELWRRRVQERTRGLS